MQRVPHPSRAFREGWVAAWSPKRPAPSRRARWHWNASAASPPTPSTPLRAGSCKKRKEGAPTVVLLERKPKPNGGATGKCAQLHSLAKVGGVQAEPVGPN